MIIYSDYSKENRTIKDILITFVRYPKMKVVVISPSYRQSKEILKDLENEYWEIKGEYESDNCKIQSTNIYFFPMDMDGSKIRSFRAEHIIINNYKEINKDGLETVIKGYMAYCKNPIEEVKKRKLEDGK